MESFVALLGIAVVLFAWTNLDDLLVLLGFFSDPRFRPRHVVIGQYVGIVVLYGVSVVASLLSIVVPPAYIRLLGLAPIFVGVAKLHSLWQRTGTDEDEPDDHAIATARGGGNILAVATATLANGGDNISVYTPLFATRPALEVAAVGLVFAILTALWCLLGHWLVHHPALGAPIRRYGHRTVPFILIGFGILILCKAGDGHRYSTRSPCCDISRPSRSCSSVTRSPMVISMTFKIMKLTEKPYTSVVPTPHNWVSTEPSEPLISLLANTPVNRAPTIPPIQCTPNASSESS